METRLRCPGCGQTICFDEDETDGDAVLETHTAESCVRRDGVLCERLGLDLPKVGDARQDGERERGKGTRTRRRKPRNRNREGAA